MRPTRTHSGAGHRGASEPLQPTVIHGRDHLPGRQIALMLLLVAVYAGCYSVIKLGLDYAPPLRFAGLRAVVAGGALLALLGLRGEPLTPPRRLRPWLPAVTATGTVLAYAAMFLSPGRTSAGIASVLGNTTPLILVALGAMILGERVTSGRAAALVLGFVGASLIAYPSIVGSTAAGGVTALLPLLAATGSATESVIIRRLGMAGNARQPQPVATVALLQLAAWQLLVGGGVLLGASALFEQSQPIAWTGAFVGLLLFLALAGTAFTTALWYWLVQRQELGGLSLYLFLVPVLGLAIAAAGFGERLGLTEVVGVGLVVAGSGWSIAGTGRRERQRSG